MSIFKVKIIETLESEVSIEVDTLSEAIQEAKKRWHNSVYIPIAEKLSCILCC